MGQFIAQNGYIIFMVLIIAVMYFVVFMPQKKRDKEIKQMRNNLEVGDIVVTEGGMVGKIISTKNLETVTIEVGASKTKLEIKRWAVLAKETK